MEKTLENIVGIKFFKRKLAKLINYKNYFWIKINPVKKFPAFAPGHPGELSVLSEITFESINNLVPLLNKFSQNQGKKLCSITNIEELNNAKQCKNISHLKKLLNHYKSDKGNWHNYHLLYANLLKKKESITKILEIGLGTNNQDVIGNMGSDGIPGASLRAFKDFCPKAQIYGADIDKRVLFEEPRIKTYFVDQTSSSSLNELEKKIGRGFDLIIDDGLHSPHANLEVLLFGIKLLKKGGFLVIEDIEKASVPIWQLVIFILNREKFTPYIYEGKFGHLFVLKKK